MSLLGLPASSRGASFGSPLWAAFLLFAAIGGKVVDDFGYDVDAAEQRGVAIATVDYASGATDLFAYVARVANNGVAIAGDAVNAGSASHSRFYGQEFEFLLLAAERLLGLGADREIHLVRKLLTHLFFLAGACACGALARRLFDSRAIGLSFLERGALRDERCVATVDLPNCPAAMICAGQWIRGQEELRAARIESP